MNQEIDEQSFALKQELNGKINEIKSDSLKLIALEYDQLTKDYYDYLNQIIQGLPVSENKSLSKNKEVNKFFFDDGKGKNWVEINNIYKEKILKLTEKNLLKEKIQSDLDMENAIDKNGTKVDWLEHYFRDFPAITAVAKLKSYQKDILQLENKFIDDLLNKNNSTN
ncbi:MAG: hypothetical protein AB7D46_01545 [Flavobacteriaceae bacterium]